MPPFAPPLARCPRFSLHRPTRRPRPAVAAPAAPPRAPEPPATPEVGPLSRSIFDAVDARAEAQAGGAGGGTTYEALRRADAAWARLRTAPVGAATGPAPQFVRAAPGPLPSAPKYDAVIAGGTLGVLVGAALAARGHRVAVVEAGALRGRAQEWNISREELGVLVRAGALGRADADAAVVAEFNPVRCAFDGFPPVLTHDVLNLGVSPDAMVKGARKVLESAPGCVVLDNAPLGGVTVHANGVAATRAGADPGAPPLATGRLLVDCMGAGSPAVRQARWGTKPDGVCLVVGSCAAGPWPDNGSADVIATDSPAALAGAPVPGQFFWEAFPAGGGPNSRTTYMFTYLDAQPDRPSLAEMMDEYWRRLPAYQGVAVSDLVVERVLFGAFATYRNSPLAPQFDRVIQAGDASGIQSPLSFGGLGALSRHAPRLATALSDALEKDCLDRASLAAINAYSPGLSAAWMLQRAMSARPEAPPPSPDFINRLLGANFRAMQGAGDAAMRPFLQDVLQFGPLVRTLAVQVAIDPALVPQILAHVGPLALLDWFRHFLALGAYTFLHGAAGPSVLSVLPALPPRARFRAARLLEAWEYGSGQDYGRH